MIASKKELGRNQAESLSSRLSLRPEALVRAFVQAGGGAADDVQTN
jgi:hypothetical protein